MKSSVQLEGTSAQLGEESLEAETEGCWGFSWAEKGQKEDPGSQSRGVCESGVSEASCSLLVSLYTVRMKLNRQARVGQKGLLCFSKVVQFFPKEAIQKFGTDECCGQIQVQKTTLM